MGIMHVDIHKEQKNKANLGLEVSTDSSIGRNAGGNWRLAVIREHEQIQEGIARERNRERSVQCQYLGGDLPDEIKEDSFRETTSH